LSTGFVGLEDVLTGLGREFGGHYEHHLGFFAAVWGWAGVERCQDLVAEAGWVGGDGLAEAFEGGQWFFAAEHFRECVFQGEHPEVVDPLHLATLPVASVHPDASSADSAAVGHQEVHRARVGGCAAVEAGGGVAVQDGCGAGGA
jgi:hypothetical protein